jgi:hypothetical protein
MTERSLENERLSALSAEISEEVSRCKALGGAAYVSCNRSQTLTDKRQELDNLNTLLKPVHEKQRDTSIAYTNAEIDDYVLGKEDSFLAGFGAVPTLANVKTDADGKYHAVASVPVNKRIAIIANSSRMIGDTSENCRWFVWSGANKGSGKLAISLANDNLYETNCSLCVDYSIFLEDYLSNPK